MNRNNINYSTITPLELYFEGETDDEGKLFVKFNYKEAFFSEKYEVGLVNFFIDSNTVKNVRDKSELIEFTDNLGIKKSVYLNESKISNVNDLAREFNLLSLNCKIFVNSSGDSSSIGLTNGKLEISSRIAKCLRILTKSNQISSLTQLINDKVAKVTISGSRVVIDGSLFPSNKDLFKISDISSDVIWRFISPYSFQSILIDSDLITDEYVGSELTKTIAFIDFDPSKDFLKFEPLRIDWKRIIGGKIRSTFIRLADSRGNALKKVYCSVKLTIRKNSFR